MKLKMYNIMSKNVVPCCLAYKKNSNKERLILRAYY